MGLSGNIRALNSQSNAGGTLLRQIRCFLKAWDGYDNDNDGVITTADHCPGTQPGAPVDTAGCSQVQFCAAVDMNVPGAGATCRAMDFNNDEPGTKPKDCEPLKAKVASQCVPAE